MYAVIQFARLSGFSPIVTIASLHNASLLQDLGATHVLDRKLPTKQLIADATNIAGGSFDIVYNTVSTDETNDIAYTATAPGGTLIILEYLPELLAKGKAEGKNVHLGHGLFKAEINQDVGRSLLGALPGLLESGDIKASVCSPAK